MLCRFPPVSLVASAVHRHAGEWISVAKSSVAPVPCLMLSASWDNFQDAYGKWMDRYALRLGLWKMAVFYFSWVKVYVIPKKDGQLQAFDCAVTSESNLSSLLVKLPGPRLSISGTRQLWYYKLHSKFKLAHDLHPKKRRSRPRTQGSTEPPRWQGDHTHSSIMPGNWPGILSITVFYDSPHPPTHTFNSQRQPPRFLLYWAKNVVGPEPASLKEHWSIASLWGLPIHTRCPAGGSLSHYAPLHTPPRSFLHPLVFLYLCSHYRWNVIFISLFLRSITAIAGHVF